MSTKNELAVFGGSKTIDKAPEVKWPWKIVMPHLVQ